MDSTEFSKLFYDGIFEGFGMFLKMTWPYILGFIVLVILLEIVNIKLDIRNQKIKKEKEQAEFEKRVEIYLRKKDEHEAKKRKS